MATRTQLGKWFDEGVAEGATHMIVKWDDFEPPTEAAYPVFVERGQNVREREAEHGDKTMEVYVLDPARRDEQLSARQRVFNYD